MPDNIIIRKNNNESRTRSVVSADVYSLKSDNSEKCHVLFQLYFKRK